MRVGIAAQIRRLTHQAVVYGLGRVIPGIAALLLLPVYTHYLSPSQYGTIETLVALSTAVAAVLALGMPAAFFRFYFERRGEEYRREVVKTTIWYTAGAATAGALLGLALAEPISQAIFGTATHANLVRLAVIGVWALMNYSQVMALLRAEERPRPFVVITLGNLLITISTSLVLVVGAGMGAAGILIGSFTGNLVTLFAVVVFRRSELGFGFDFRLFRKMNHFGLPLVPTALMLWIVNALDRLLLVKLASLREVGLYAVGVRFSSAILLVVTAMTLALPAFAYSIEDEDEARRTYGYVLTYVMFVTCWMSLGLGLLAPWLVRLFATPRFYGASDVVGLLAFSGAAFAGYTVVAIALGRAHRTQFNWAVTAAAACTNVGLNLVLIPRYGMVGAAIATIAAYVVMFGGIVGYAQRVYHVPYQWRRIGTIVVVAGSLAVLGALVSFPLAVALIVTAAFPFLLAPLGFYLPAERRRLRSLALRYGTPGYSSPR